MRAGACTVQQTLTAEAATVVKHAVGLARRRGHGQVTPLHVAITMLGSSGASLLRRACLQSHSHPLQCRALELCFNVALNRLPTTTAGPMVQGIGPSLSNALVAAFKRAQANQRRGCVEHQQQQPLLAVKVEMEQLIISILDDPSVSRVMREAGFSSPQVKKNLEETINFEICTGSVPKTKEIGLNMAGILAEPLSTNCATSFWQGPQQYYNVQNNLTVEKPARLQSTINMSFANEDVRNVVENLLSKKRSRNTVIVGECLFSAENVVKELMVRVDNGDVPDPLKGVQFINPQFSSLSFRLLSRDYVEQKLGELRRMIKSATERGLGAIIYVGDLRWAIDQDVKDGSHNNNNNYYCPVEHVTMELERILSCHADSRRLWLMATATYQTYIRCQMKQPSLETLWGLHPVPVPAGSLGLSLSPSETTQDLIKTQQMPWRMQPALKTLNSDEELNKQLNCCPECSVQFERELQNLSRSTANTEDSLDPPSNLPSWLRQCKNDAAHSQAMTSAETIRNLCEKWNQICSSLHSQQHRPKEIQFELSTSSCEQYSRMNSMELNNNINFSSHPQTQIWPTSQLSQSQAWSVIGVPLHLCSSKPSNTHENLPWIKTQQFWTVNENDTVQSGHYNSTRQQQQSFSIPSKITVSHQDFTGLDLRTTLALGRSASGKGNDELDCTVLEGCHNSRIQEAKDCSASSCDHNGSQNLPSMDTSTPPESMLSDVSDNGSQERIYKEKYIQFDTESFNRLCKGLEEKVISQREIIPVIASTVLLCRSAIMRRGQGFRNTMLLFMGPDTMGKIKIAKALAEIVFGSEDKLAYIGQQNSVSNSESHNQLDNTGKANHVLEGLIKAIRLNPHSVIIVEEIHQSDSFSMAAITKAMERGNLTDTNGEEVILADSIIIMTSSLGSKYLPSVSENIEGFQEDDRSLSSSKKTRLELLFQGEHIMQTPDSKPGSETYNIADSMAKCNHESQRVGSPCIKRKADWDMDESIISHNNSEKRNKNSPFALDLNLCLQENEAGDVSTTVSSTISTHPGQFRHEYFPREFLKFVDKTVIFHLFDSAGTLTESVL
eukprot:Gb_33499 [translate_table: standard]